MALTEIKTSGIADDAVTTDKLANAINTERTANTAKPSLANDANNRVVTGDGSGGLNGEANLTFDGTKLGIGTTDPDGILHISSGNADSDCVVIIQSDEDNNDENSNPQLWFKQDGDISAGFVGMSSNETVIANNISTQGAISFRTGTANNTGTTDPLTSTAEKFRITNNGDVKINDGDLVIGTAGHGIDFSATSDGGTVSSEVLADYEEGTFTPSLRVHNGSSWSDAGFGDGIRKGFYTKVGDIVHVQMTFNNFHVNSTHDGDLVAIGNFPFTSTNTAYRRSTLNITDCNAFVSSDPFNIRVDYNNTDGITRKISGTASDYATISGSSGRYMTISGCYAAT